VEARVILVLEGLNETESEREGGIPVDPERFHKLVGNAPDE
jgi:hypothetical protein